jgi:hypothetical protein
MLNSVRDIVIVSHRHEWLKVINKIDINDTRRLVRREVLNNISILIESIRLNVFREVREQL